MVRTVMVGLLIEVDFCDLYFFDNTDFEYEVVFPKTICLCNDVHRFFTKYRFASGDVAAQHFAYDCG